MSERVHYDCAGGLGRIRLDDGKANAIQAEWCTEMNAALDRAAADESRAIVVTGRPGFLSGGLDLKVLPHLSPDALRATTDRFSATMKRLFLFEKPIVVASAGHAIAGGTMLLLCADVRLALDERSFRYGLNEAVTGIPLAGGTLGICTSQIPPQHHAELILHGRLVDAPTLQRYGVIQELAPPDDLEARAEARARALFDVDLAVYAINKRLLRAEAFAGAVRLAAQLEAELPGSNPFARIAR